VNETPVSRPQPQPNPAQATVPVAEPIAPVTPQLSLPPTPPASQLLSTWSLVLGIVALVLGIVVFISIPAAIVAVILGIIVLAKHHPGKGKALAGIITGGVALIFIPILFMITLVAYNGITERANQLKQTSTQQAAATTVASSDGITVNTPCYSYTIPTSYVYDDASKDCTTAVNIPNGDALSRITVKGNTGTIGSLKDVVATFNKAAQSSNAVIDQEQLTTNGRTAYYISYKDTNGLLFGNYIIPDSSASRTVGGKTITAYTVAGYVYNSSLKALVHGVFDSLVIK
jgi:hypothetical protein